MTHDDGSGIGGETYTPLVPEVMENLSVLVYQPPTKMALLKLPVTPKGSMPNRAVSRVMGSPVVSQ